MGPIIMSLAAVHEPNKEPGRATHDLHNADSQSEARDRRERDDQGAVAEEVPPLCMSGNDDIGGDAHETIHQGTSPGA